MVKRTFRPRQFVSGLSPINRLEWRSGRYGSVVNEQPELSLIRGGVFYRAQFGNSAAREAVSMRPFVGRRFPCADEELANLLDDGNTWLGIRPDLLDQRKKISRR